MGWLTDSHVTGEKLSRSQRINNILNYQSWFGCRRYYPTPAARAVLLGRRIPSVALELHQNQKGRPARLIFLCNAQASYASAPIEDAVRSATALGGLKPNYLRNSNERTTPNLAEKAGLEFLSPHYYLPVDTTRAAVTVAIYGVKRSTKSYDVQRAVAVTVFRTSNFRLSFLTVWYIAHRWSTISDALWLALPFSIVEDACGTTDLVPIKMCRVNSDERGVIVLINSSGRGVLNWIRHKIVQLKQNAISNKKSSLNIFTPFQPWKISHMNSRFQASRSTKKQPNKPTNHIPIFT